MERQCPVERQSKSSAECVTQQDCESMIQRLLWMQKTCRQSTEGATLGSLVPVRDCYQQTLQQLRVYCDKSKCHRCTSIKIRRLIQSAEQHLLKRINYYPEVDDTKQQKGESSLSMKTSVFGLQVSKRSLIYISLYCRKGQKFRHELHKEVDQISQDAFWCNNWFAFPQAYDQKMKEKMDTDKRPAPETQNCPTFNHWSDLINHLKAIATEYCEVPKPLSVHNQQSLLQDLSIASQLLKAVLDQPQCQRCRIYSPKNYMQLLQNKIKSIKEEIYSNVFGTQFKCNLGRLLTKQIGCLKQEWTITNQTKQNPYEPVNAVVVNNQECSTRKEATILQGQFEQLLSAFNELLQVDDSSTIRQIFQQKMPSLRQIWKQYMRMPKCQQCFSEKCRVQRELLMTNFRSIQTQVLSLNQSHKFVKHTVHMAIVFIIQALKRAIGWCQKQKQN